jgi:hypothetical protein
VGLFALALASFGPVPAATAGTDRCVTRAEFQHVHKGMTRRAVERAFDTHGRMGAGGAGGFTRNYRECVGHGSLTVTYTVTMKDRTPKLYAKTWNSKAHKKPVHTSTV